jgi:hypothetical protein
MAFSNISRYLLTDVIVVRSGITGAITRPPFVDLRQRVSATAIDDREVIWDTVDDWATLALKYLDDARNWWVAADLSGIVDPFEELVESKQLRVPALSRLQLDILPSDRGSF